MANTYLDPSALSNWRLAMVGSAITVGKDNASALQRIEQMLSGNSGRVRLDEYVELLEVVGQSCRPSSLAWNTGCAVDLPFDENFGKAILGCKSLGTALHWMSQYFPLLQDASILRLDVEEDWTTLSYKILDPEIWPRHEDAMYTLGICARLIKAAAPEAWNQIQITVEAEPEQVKADLEGIVQTTVIYGGAANAIRFPTALVNAPLTLVQPCSPTVLKQLTADLTQKRRSTPTAERTRRMIYREMNEGSVSQNNIAKELGVSSRTLRRRLARENQSFQALLDECRMQFAALEFRTREKLSLSEMALKLGYSEHSTFSRAFARWAGMAPQEYRRTVSLH